jgi:hypothetical protein
MKLFNSLFIRILICFSLISCEKNNNCVSIPLVESGICINLALIDSTDSCIEIYDPICGCDGVTYSNYCYADISGVTSYVAGECCD